MTPREYLLDRLDIISISGEEARVKNCLHCGRPRTMKLNLETFWFICHHPDCEVKGKLFALINLMEEDEDEARRVYKELVRNSVKSKFSISRLSEMLEEYKEEKSLKEQTRNVELPDEFIPCFKDGKWSIPKYLTSAPRSLSKDDIARWGIGFCKKGQYGGRVLVPVICDGMSSFVARAVSSETYPKYLNPTLAAQEYMLFGYDELDPDKMVIAVEGVWDAIRLWSYGYQAVAYFGAHIRPPQIRLLRKLGVSDLVIMPDSGDKRAVSDAFKRYSSLQGIDRVRIALVEDGLDPDEADPDQIKRAIRKSRPPSSMSNLLDGIGSL